MIKLKLKSRILLPVIIIMLLVVVMASAFWSVRFSGFARQLFSDKVEAAAKGMKKYLASNELATQTAAAAQASRAELRQAVVRRDTAGIIRLLNPVINSGGMDYFTVCDKKGFVLARTLEPSKTGDIILHMPGIQKALDGKRSTYYDSDRTVKVSIRTDEPVYDRFGALIGVISAGIRLDSEAVVDYLKEHYDADFTVFFGDERVATTIRQNQKRITGSRLAAATANIVCKNKQEYFNSNIDVLGMPYSAFYFPVINSEGSCFAIIAAGYSNRALINEVNTVNLGILVIGLSGLAVAILILYRIVSGIINPVNRLRSFVYEVSQGNLNSIVTGSFTGPDNEIGELIQDVYKLIDVIRAMLGDISQLTKIYTESGDFDYRIDVSKYNGAYREMAGSINALLGVTVDDMLLIIGYLDRIINGNFEIESKKLPGKKIIINTAFENLRKNISGVNNEISLLIKAAIDGELKRRGMSETFKGDWQKLIERLNILMEVWETYLDIFPEPLMILDRNLNPVYINKLYDMNFGTGSIMELIFGESYDHLTIMEILSRSISGTESTGQYIYQLTIDNYEGTKYFSVVLTPIVYNEEIINVIVLAADITELTEEKERALDASRAKSDFLAKMSHEIRTPMNAVLGMSELLLSENLSVQQKRYAEDIKTSAMTLLDIINEILDHSRIQSGKMNIDPVHYFFDSLIEYIGLMMPFLLKNKDISFKMETHGDMPECLYGDDVRLRQVILNLLGNAVKFTEKGFILLTIAVTHTDIHFTIKDTGIGIKEEDIPYIFEPFKQSDEVKNRNYKGTGLGLAISKALVEMMNGKLYIESEYGHGATFHLTIPKILGDKNLISNTGDEKKVLSVPEAKILVVDDNEININVISGLLRLSNITVSTALSGPEAIEMTMQNKYDLIFMDHMMPEMDGVETVARMREKGVNTPVIALTANAGPSARDMLLSAGMKDFISKPILKKELNEVLLKWIPGSRYISPGPEEAAPANEGDGSAGFLEKLARVGELSVQTGMDRVSGQGNIYESTLKLLMKGIEKYSNNLTGCLAAADIHNFEIEVHSLKSSLANTGAMDLSAKAYELEAAASRDDIDFCQKMLPPFLDRLHNFKLSLYDVFSGLHEDNGPVVISRELEALLSVIKDALGSMNYQEINRGLVQLETLNYSGALNDQIEEIEDAIIVMDYDSAIKQIEKLLCRV